MDSEFRKSVSSLVVEPKFSKEQRARIAEEWTHNLKRYIVGFVEEEIISLRDTVEKSTLAGNRYGSLVKGIQSSYGVTANKAKFWARQETKLLTSKLQETRYQEAGVNEYRWRCVRGSSKHPVRPRHQELNDMSEKGKVFRFDDPPVTTEPGDKVRRNNPGEDYGCRCKAHPVIRIG